MADSLHDELLAIPGIASAEFEGTEDHPLGVRVQLAVGADPDSVGREVQRVLATHGMRSQLAEDEQPASIVNLSDYESPSDESAEIDDTFEPAADEASSGAQAGGEPSARGSRNDAAPIDEAAPTDAVSEADLQVMPGPPPVVDMPQVAVDSVSDDPAAGSGESAPTVLAGVAVEEDESRVTITVRSAAGESSSRSVPATQRGLDEAAALAAADLVMPEMPPRVVAITDSLIDGSPVVTVVLEGRNGRRMAGASVVHGSRAYAVALAAWAAVSR